LLAAVAVTAGWSGAAVISKSYDFTQSSVTFGQDTVDSVVYDRVRMSGLCSDFYHTGAPELPQKTVYFMVPWSDGVDSVNVSVVSADTFTGPYKLIPVQPAGCSMCSPTGFLPPVPYYYDRDYPTNCVDDVVENNMSNYRLVSLSLRPLRRLLTGQIVKTKQLTVEVWTSGRTGLSGVVPRRRSEFCDQELRKAVCALVENPEAVTWASQVPIQDRASPLVITPDPSLEGSCVDCLIITEDASVPAYKAYADFWTERGIVTCVRPISEIHPRYGGRDKPESMRNYLKAADSLWGIGFAILGGWQVDPHGDTGLPTRLVPMPGDFPIFPPGSVLDEWTTADKYFSDLDGTWEEDRDNIFGEPFVPMCDMSSMAFVDELHGCATTPVLRECGDQSLALWTEDGGLHWEFSNSLPSHSVVSDMSFGDGQTGYLVGSWSNPDNPVDRLLVCKTTNGGSVWLPCPLTPRRGALRAIHTVSPSEAWTVGGEGNYVRQTVMHTTDFGASWPLVQMPPEPDGAEYLDVRFSPTGDTGWILVRDWLNGNNNYLARTTNHGLSWVTGLASLPGPYFGVFPFVLASAGDTLWAGGLTTPGGNTRPTVWKSSDAGSSWSDPIELADYGNPIVDLTAVVEPLTGFEHVWAVSADKIFYRGPAGDWVLQNRPAGGVFHVHHVQFTDVTHGWCGGSGTPAGRWGVAVPPLCLRTTDGGGTWLLCPTNLYVGDSSVTECMPDIMLGRLPTRPGTSDAGVVISKLQQYQTNPDLDMGADILLCVNESWIQECEEAQQAPWYPSGFLSTYRLYWPLGQGDAEFSKENLVANINAGSMFLAEAYHAGIKEWVCPADEQWFRYLDLKEGRVTNGNKCGIVTSNGCHACFLLDDSAIGRHFLTCPTGGSVAYAGWPCAWWFGSPLIGLRMMEQVYGPGISTLGPAHSNAMALTYAAYLRVVHILGDPMMDIWDSVPRSFVMRHPTSWSLQPGLFEVTVTDEQTEELISGARVCLSLKDPSTGTYSEYHVGLTEDGVASFMIDPMQTGEMAVTVTKHGYLPKRQTCHIGLFTLDPNATAGSQQRNLVRVVGTDTLHLVYTDMGVIMHTISPDAGLSWQRPEPVGIGDHPAITLNNLQQGGSTVRSVPWVTYKHGDDIMLVVLHQGSPPSPFVVFDGTSPDSLAYPAAIAAEPLPDPSGPTAWITFEVTGITGSLSWSSIRAKRVVENAILQSDILDTRSLELECSRPSITISPGNEVHVAWQRLTNTSGCAVCYSRFTTFWTMPWEFLGQLPGSHNPFVETFGDSVWCAFSAPASQPDCYKVGRWLQQPYYVWSFPPQNFSNTSACSDNPVLSWRDANVWQEDVDGYGDVFYNVGGVIHNLTSTPLNSTFPSIDYKIDDQVSRLTVYTVWTEEVVAGQSYEVKSTSFDWLPQDGPPKSVGTYYAVATGDSAASPYCVHRTGAVKLGPYALDYGLDSLDYTLPYLDPQYDYYVRAVMYQQGQRDWRQRVRVDDSLNLTVSYKPHKPETLWVQIPAGCYRRDAKTMANMARLVGQYSVLTDFSVIQREPMRSRPPRGQGGQTASVFPMHVEFGPAVPNPFRQAVRLRFALSRAGNVGLRVFDVSGRLTRDVGKSELPAGYHSACWDGRDASGRLAPAGTYFLRLGVDERTYVRRVVLTR
jgi:photosystem II stability/assembly factor-like uncharacterized protein